MSQKKRKNSNYKTDIINKSYYQRNKLVIAFIIIFIIFYFVYNWILKEATLNVHSPYFFANVKSFFNVRATTLPVGIVGFFALAFYCDPSREMSNKKFIRIAGVIVLIIFGITIIRSCNVWAFNENTISYNTLFKKNAIVYTYDDIDSAQLSCDYGHRYAGLTYSLNMSDGKEIKFDITQSFCNDEKRLFQFDNMISSKRDINGEYYSFGRKSDEFNDYFRSVFDNDQ